VLLFVVPHERIASISSMLAERALQSWEATQPQRLYVNDDDSVCVPLLIPAGAERDQAVEDVLQQLEVVDRTLAGAGLVRPAATPALQP
jgi:hypothetical protein